MEALNSKKTEWASLPLAEKADLLEVCLAAIQQGKPGPVFSYPCSRYRRPGGGGGGETSQLPAADVDTQALVMPRGERLTLALHGPALANAWRNSGCACPHALATVGCASISSHVFLTPVLSSPRPCSCASCRR